MKRVEIPSIVLLLMITLISSARAELLSARIVLGSRELTMAPAAVFDGNRVLAPVGILELLGASWVASGNAGRISVTSALGETGEVETADANGTPMIPVDKLARIVGADCRWDPDTRTLALFARVMSVEFVDDTLKVNCSLPVSYKVSAWSSNNKLIVDVNYSKLATPANEVYINMGLVQRARLGQLDENTTRVVLDLGKNLPYRIDSSPVDSGILVKVAEGLAAPVPQATDKSQAGQAQPFKIEDVRVTRVDDYRFQVVIATSGKGSVTPLFSAKPARVTLNLNGGTLSDHLVSHSGSHELISGVRIAPTNGGGSTSIEMDLKRAMIHDVNVDDYSITVTLRPPNKSGGRLADKLIVIDPGHGGNQAGARCNGCSEKNFNMMISKELARQLESQGARVILTRSGDQAMGLAARSEVAINSGADFFVSVHCNSNGRPNSVSGIETYYHMYDPSQKMLANAVHDAVCAVTGMCDRKARSDRALYSSGLAVLRRLEGSGIPGILIECGYMNHASDRSRLLDAGYREKLASGIVAGLREYVEGK